jgi:hypothetical protein
MVAPDGLKRGTSCQGVSRKQITMTEIPNPKHFYGHEETTTESVLVIEYSGLRLEKIRNLRFVCNLVLVICGFRLENSRDSSV